MGAHDFKLKNVHLYAQRPVNINFLSSADPKLALVPACVIYRSYILMFVPSFILIERGLDVGPILHTKQDALFARK